MRKFKAKREYWPEWETFETYCPEGDLEGMAEEWAERINAYYGYEPEDYPIRVEIMPSENSLTTYLVEVELEMKPVFRARTIKIS